MSHSARFFDSLQRNVGRANTLIHDTHPNFNAFGRRFNTATTMRYGTAFGLGAVALRNAQDSYHKLKYGEIGGSMLSAAMGTAAAAGAFHMATEQNAMRQVLNFTGIRLGKAAAFIRSGIR